MPAMVSLQQSYNENMAMVGLDSMKTANSTIEDFCRTCFMFHGLDVSKPQTIFKYLPILSFTESYIYQLDQMNENLLPTLTDGDSVFGGKDEEETQVLLTCFSNDPFEPLETLLECEGLLTRRIREELRHGVEYWALERKLCFALINNEEVEELHMEFLSISDFLTEVSDDLYDYEDDVLQNSFNMLRMMSICFLEICWIADILLITISNLFLESLDPQLSLSHLKRCEEDTKKGGELFRPSLGALTIPTVIPDEEMYRSKLKSDTS
ncbi:hypothetical protein RIF29_30024 [Crotalaria pallida]|uniref:Uncharacterized protein n=1 Tax=Crotalaria pallida TaxID=3830 RepID=A0AAN9HXY9_CROPI